MVPGLLGLPPLAQRLPGGVAAGTFGVALDTRGGGAAPRIVGINRRRRAGRGEAQWRTHGRLVEALPLETYIECRRSIGGTAEAAETEWRAGRLLRGALAANA